MEPLHPVEVRVLGSLLEKDLATPEYYPLTLNALVNACNQKSSREPVVHYSEETVRQAAASLQQRGLVTRLSGVGHRVEKYGHRLGEMLNLGRRELAVLCVLMLRGAQTVGELRSRAERMHAFSDLEEVESVLESLAQRESGALAAPGQRGRWMHLWSGAAAAPGSAPAGEPPRDALEERVAALETEVAGLKLEIESLRRQFE